MAALEVVQALYGAFGRGDVPAILGMLSPDAAWSFPGPSEYPVFGDRRGPDGALAFFQALGANEDISEFTPQRFHACGDTVVVEGHGTLTLKKNGAPVAYDWAHIFSVADGKVTGFRGLVDTGQIVDAYRA